MQCFLFCSFRQRNVVKEGLKPGVKLEGVEQSKSTQKDAEVPVQVESQKGLVNSMQKLVRHKDCYQLTH